MFAFAVLALVPLASALVIPRGKPVPSNYAQGYLEGYDVYNARYLALDCEAKHNTQFFSDCCHPMLATENLKDNRKPYCTPSPQASSSASLALSTSTVQPSGDPDCDDVPSSSFTNLASATSVPPPANVAPAPSSASEATSSPAPSPSPSSSAPSPSPSPPANDNSGLGNIIGEVFQGGEATFFYQNGNPGNCGQVHQDTDFIVALPTSVYGNGEHCGKSLVLMDVTTGHVEHAIVADSCPTCTKPTDLDLSFKLFTQFSTADAGVFDLKWAFT